MKTDSSIMFAIVLALGVVGGCAQKEQAQPFGARAQLAKLSLGIGGGPPATVKKEMPSTPSEQIPLDRAGRGSLGTTTMTPPGPTPVGPGAHGEMRGQPGATPTKVITDRK
jgi:hypothetical protein